MKIKSIEKLLNGVMDKFMKELPPEIAEILKYHSYITGGCIPSMAMGEFVNDYDVYLTDRESVDKIKEYFSKIENSISDKSFRINLITDNAINLDNKIQIITKYYGPPNLIINKFDWAHIKSFYTGGVLTLCPDFYQYIVEKELVYTGSDYPLSSLLRTRKFIKKGWHISTKTMTNIALDIVTKIKFIEPLIIEDPITNKIRKGHYEYKDKNADIIDIEAKFIEHEEKVMSIDDVIEQLNGVDPLTIQQALLKHTGEYLTIKQIINLL